MNAPLRRLAIVAALLLTTLLTSTTYVQFVAADSLNNRPGNSRSLYKQFAHPRGALLVGGQPIAESKPVNDSYGYQRTYTSGPLYSAITGYFSVVYGSSGMESAVGDTLSGTGDQQFIQRISDLFTGGEASGASVQLTINAKAQQAAWDALGTQRGAVVALDPKTGAILTLVSKPGFDPNLLAGHSTKQLTANWKKLLADPSRPMDNRAIAGRQYAPGSTFKIVTSAAALSSGDYTPESPEIPGPRELELPQSTVTLPNDDRSACLGGSVTLLEALEISCNTAFGRLGMDLGEQALEDQARAFGFGQALQIPLRVTPSSFPSGLSKAQLAQSAIGQYNVRVTPLQVCMVSAAIANGGELMQPYLNDSVLGPNLEVKERTQPRKLRRAVSESKAEQLTKMMEAVVQNSNGTGRRAQIPGVKVAGKTGTAQQGEGQPPNVWFTAFAPADDPKVAVAVVVEDGGTMDEHASGGRVAAPVAKKVIQAVLQQ